MGIDVAREFAGLRLGDERLNARGRALVVGLSARPAMGAPSVLSDAELEGYYRFVNNRRVSFAALLNAHTEATVARVANAERLVIAHDTTDFRFADEVERAGLGPMDNAGQGFYAHFSLAVGPQRTAFGVVGAEIWTRSSRNSTKKTQAERYNDPKKESLRWMRGVDATERVFSGGPRLIHVMDCEADDFDILTELTQKRLSFVVRGQYDRRLAVGGPRLKSFVRDFEVRCEREAQLSSRRKNRSAKDRKAHPPREVRTARLTFAAGTVALRRPDESKAELSTLTLNVVHVLEPSPPEGCKPVEWFLLTSESIETEEQILQIVDDYRGRWVIEEYFKALKTGCAYEKRQHETKEALLNALGIYIPIAWALLNMRSLSRAENSSSIPADRVLTATQLQILRIRAKGKLPETPTVGQAVYMLARVFGGLQPSNGLPGWSVLGRAFEQLLTLEAGWLLAAAALAPHGSDR